MTTGAIHEPERLYHYTTPAGLLGISESRKLWATHIRYLNDSTEYVHAIEVAHKVVLKRSDLTPQEVEFFGYLLGKSEIGAWIRSRLFGADFYVTSLTKAPDLLSQWRTYAPKSGYCIGWKVEAIQRVANQTGFMLRECIYDLDVQSSRISVVVEESLNRLRTTPVSVDFNGAFWSPRDESELTAYAELSRQTEAFDAAFAEVACICKHPSFSEEREWRLVSSRYPNGRRPVPKYRVGKSVLIPFIEVDMDFERLGVLEADAQTRIICGPSPEIDLAQQAALQLFGGWRGGAWTTQSKVPYRDW